MRISHRLLAIAILVSFLVAGNATLAWPQSLPQSDKSSVDGQRPKSTGIGFFELLDSTSSAFFRFFEGPSAQPTLNNPEWNSNESPRHTVMTFVEAMRHVSEGRDEAFPRALETFGENVSVARRQAAYDLQQVFDRLPELSAGTIPGPEAVRQQDIRRFELFPRGIEHEWVYRALDKAPDGKIVLVQSDSGSWHFNSETIDGANELASSMKPIPPRRLNFDKANLIESVLEPTFTKATFVDWLFFFFSAFSGGVLAWLVVKILRRIKSRRANAGDELLLPLLNGIIIPVAILIVSLGISIGTAKLHVHPTLAGWRNAVMATAVVIAGLYLTVSIIELACLGVRRAVSHNNDPYARMVSMMIRRTVRIVAVVVVGLFLLQNVLQWNVTALLGGFAIIALALSLAAQDAVKNLFGAFTIFATRPFMTGDWVRFNNHIGQIDDVSLQATKIRLLSGEVMSVPNMKFIDNHIVNISERQYLRRIMEIAITYDTPARKVQEAIEILKEILSSKKIVGEGQGDMDQHPPQVWFDRFGDHYLNLRADYWYLMSTEDGEIQRDTERGWFSYLDHATIVNQMVLERFNDAGIDFAFPTQSLYLADDPKRKLKVSRPVYEEAS